MNKYRASVENKMTGELSLIDSEYDSYTEFKADLRGNGYIVKAVIILEGKDDALQAIIDARAAGHNSVAAQKRSEKIDKELGF